MDRRPARLASVCKAWNKLLDSPSSVWDSVILYGGKSSAPVVPPDGGNLTEWLRARLAAIHDLTFYRFRVGSPIHRLHLATQPALFARAPPQLCSVSAHRPLLSTLHRQPAPCITVTVDLQR